MVRTGHDRVQRPVTALTAAVGWQYVGTGRI